MALDGIGALRLDIADREANQIERNTNVAGIPTGALQGVGAIVDKSTSKFEDIVRLEADTQQKQQQKELLASGVDGVVAYATELELPDPEKYRRMGSHITNEKDFMNLYEMAKKDRSNLDKKAADKAIAFKSHEVLTEAERMIEEMNASGDFSNAEKVQSRLNELQSDPDLDRVTAQRINALGDNIRKTSGTALARKSAATTRQRNKDEGTVRKSMDTVIKGGRGGQRAFGVPLAKMSSIMDGLDTIEGIKQGEFKATQEIAAELGSIISQVLSVGGSTTEGDRRALTPKSMGGDIESTIQYVSGNPQDALSKKLMSQLEHMLDRERQFWKKELSAKNNLLFNQVRPVFDRKGSDGKFLNRDLMGDWINLLESSDGMSDLSRKTHVANVRGRDKEVDKNTTTTPTSVRTPTPESGDMSQEEFMQRMSQLGGGR